MLNSGRVALNVVLAYLADRLFQLQPEKLLSVSKVKEDAVAPVEQPLPPAHPITWSFAPPISKVMASGADKFEVHDVVAALDVAEFMLSPSHLTVTDTFKGYPSR